MGKITLAHTISEKRREKGITQEQLAEFVGVTKASVSKWETGQSLPDLTLLPCLAAYFNISVDELIGFRPEMTQDEIRRFHRETAEAFTHRPFREVMEKCRKTAKEYYSCFPLLFQISSLMINHCGLCETSEERTSILQEAKEFLTRVRTESNDVLLAKQALSLEAYCLIALCHPDEALDLLAHEPYTYLPSEPLIASAWQMKGRPEKAVSVLQAGIYQNFLSLLSQMSSYLDLCTDRPDTFRETWKRICILADVFQVEQLNPGVFLSTCLKCAYGFLIQNDNTSALDVLEKYVRCACGNIYPLHLHGDRYFDQLDDWLNHCLDLGGAPPRNDAAIRQDIVSSVTENPAFLSMKDNPRFCALTLELSKLADPGSQQGGSTE